MDSITLISQFLFTQFIEEPDDLKQTYIVLHAASFSSWIDITNHKGKHWTELILWCGSAFQLLLNFCFIE